MGGDDIGIDGAFRRGIFDGADPTYQRFIVSDFEVHETAQIASRANIYVHFPVVGLGLPQLAKNFEKPADLRD